METLYKVLRAIFFPLLQLYPRRFREAFEEEMQTTFDDEMSEAVSTGMASVLSIWLRELASLPLSILREFWHETTRRETVMATQIKKQAPVARRGTWGQVILAALPHLAFALGAGRGAFMNIQGDADNWFNLYVGIPLLVGFIAAAYYAWREGWPRWTASWFGYWTWIWVVIFIYIVAYINSKLEFFDELELTLGMLILMLGMLLIGLFALFRVDRIMGLLAASFLMPVALPGTIMEFVPNRIQGMLTLGSGFAAAFAAAYILRRGEWRSGLWITLCCNLLIGIAYAYVQAYRLEYPYPIPQTVKPSDFFVTLLIFITTSAILIAGPWIFWNAWDFGKRRLRA